MFFNRDLGQNCNEKINDDLSLSPPTWFTVPVSCAAALSFVMPTTEPSPSGQLPVLKPNQNCLRSEGRVWLKN